MENNKNIGEILNLQYMLRTWENQKHSANMERQYKFITTLQMLSNGINIHKKSFIVGNEGFSRNKILNEMNSTKSTSQLIKTSNGIITIEKAKGEIPDCVTKFLDDYIKTIIGDV